MISEKQFPADLIESLKSGDVAAFIGAGISMGAGLPGWVDLARALADPANLHLPEKNEDIAVQHLLMTFQNYENQYGRHSLLTQLQRMLYKQNLRPSTCHAQLASLPIKIFLTTNYDYLIERSIRKLGLKVNVVAEENELAFWREDQIQVLKLCGDITRLHTIAVTQRDFSTYFSRHARFAEKVRGILESKTVLFLGYSMQDPFLNTLWDTVGYDFGWTRRPGYIVLFDSDLHTLDDLSGRGIVSINLSSKDETKSSLMETWLRELSVRI
jgi:hypothetical protein